MFNKTVNDTSYSSNKNEKNFLQSVLSPIKICINNRKAEVNEFKNSCKAESHYLKEYKLDILFSFVVTVLIAGFILKLFDYIANFYLSCPIVKTVVLLAAFAVLLLAFYVNLILKKCYLHGFIISFLTYICSIAYMDVLNDIIQHIPIIGDFIAILVAAIYFAITCSFIYRSFQLVLKENTKYIILTSFLPIILGIIFSSRGIFNNYIFYLITFLVGFFTVLVSFENLSVLARKIFRLNIKGTEENKYKLIKVKVLILLSQVLIVPSYACLNFLCKNYYDGKNKNLLKYVDIHSYTGNGLFLIIIFLIFYSITYLIFFMCKKSIKKFIEKYLDYEKSIKHEVHTYRNHRYICKFKKRKNVK